VKKYKLLVLSNCAPGTDDEFNRWYNEVHIPEVLQVPGFTGAWRGPISEVTAEGSEHRFCAVYDFESDDVGATLGELAGRAADGRMHMSDTLDIEGVSMRAFEVQSQQ